MVQNLKVMQEFQAIREQLRNYIIGVFSDIAVFDLKKFDQFKEEMSSISLGIPVAKGYFEKIYSEFENYLKPYRQKIEAAFLNKKNTALQRWLIEYDQICGQIAALVRQIKKKYLAVYQKTFTYGQAKVFIVENIVEKSKSVGSVFYFGEQLIVKISKIVPEPLRIPVIEHEIAEINYLQFHGGTVKQAHNLAGVPTGRKKAGKLGVLREFLEFERAFGNKM